LLREIRAGTQSSSKKPRTKPELGMSRSVIEGTHERVADYDRDL